MGTNPVSKLNLALSKKKPTNEFRFDSGIVLLSYRVNVTSCNLCARAKVKGHRELKIEQNPSFRKIGRVISKLVPVLVLHLWAMVGKNGTVFDNIGRHFSIWITPELPLVAQSGLCGCVHAYTCR